MGANSKIAWCDHTFNPWYGCQKVGPGCDNCYAEEWGKRSGLVEFGPHAERRRSSPLNWRLPLKWDEDAKLKGVRYRVFCASLGDVFDNAVPAQWRADLLQLIKDTPNLDWLLLTKRIGNAGEMLQNAADLMDTGMGVFAPSIYPNMWLGITICNQEEADRDIPKLLRIPAEKRFLSIEPMLGPIDLECTGALGCNCSLLEFYDVRIEERCSGGCAFYKHSVDKKRIDWVIVGGETGSKARPMHPDWVCSIRDQCKDAVPFLFKQWGEWFPRSQWEDNPELVLPDEDEEWPDDGKTIVMDDETLHRVGKTKAGRLLDGQKWEEVP